MPPNSLTPQTSSGITCNGCSTSEEMTSTSLSQGIATPSSLETIGSTPSLSNGPSTTPNVDGTTIPTNGIIIATPSTSSAAGPSAKLTSQPPTFLGTTISGKPYVTSSTLLIDSLTTQSVPEPTLSLPSSSSVLSKLGPSTTIANSVSSVTSSSAFPTRGPVGTSPSSTSSGLSIAAKLGVGVGASLGTVIVVLLAAILWRQENRQKRKSGTSGKERKEKKEKKHRTWIPWLQQKGELDAEEQRRNELEAIGMARELEAEERHELASEEPRRELGNDECAQEREIPEKPGESAIP